MWEYGIGRNLFRWETRGLKGWVFFREWNVEWERNYVDGEEEGKSVWYDEDGNITDEDIYKDGECVEMCEGDEKE